MIAKRESGPALVARRLTESTLAREVRHAFVQSVCRFLVCVIPDFSQINNGWHGGRR